MHRDGKTEALTPNRINRCFEAYIIHQKNTTHSIALKYYEKDFSGKLQQRKAYLDPNMVLYKRTIPCYHLGDRTTGETFVAGPEKAGRNTSEYTFKRTIHSDQVFCLSDEAL